MSHKILIVEDDIQISKIVEYNLVESGYEVITAFDGEEGYRKIMDEDPDLILLDIMMPKMDGLDLCKKVRESKETPIIMLTARAEEVDKVLGFDLGADDYVTKPFSMAELKVRIKANLKRIVKNGMEIKSEYVKVKDLFINKEMMTIKQKDKIINLTIREMDILTYLIESRGAVVSREELLEEVWGYEYIGDVRTVDVAIRRLRVKLEKNSDKKYVKTKRNLGYYFDYN